MLHWLLEALATIALGVGAMIVLTLVLCGVIALRVIDPVSTVNATVILFVVTGFWGVGQLVRNWLASRKPKPE